jgi:DNA-binding response OmpR family regulator
MPDLLLVEDDRDVREAIAEVLEQEGYAVVQARSGVEAIRWLNDAPAKPAAILLDLMMPIMDGWEFMSRWQKNQAWSSIPIVVISADSNAKERIEALQTTAAYMRKPIDIDELLALLARLSQDRVH